MNSEVIRQNPIIDILIVAYCSIVCILSISISSCVNNNGSSAACYLPNIPHVRRESHCFMMLFFSLVISTSFCEHDVRDCVVSLFQRFKLWETTPLIPFMCALFGEIEPEPPITEQHQSLSPISAAQTRALCGGSGVVCLQSFMVHGHKAMWTQLCHEK